MIIQAKNNDNNDNNNDNNDDDDNNNDNNNDNNDDTDEDTSLEDCKAACLAEARCGGVVVKDEADGVCWLIQDVEPAACHPWYPFNLWYLRRGAATAAAARQPPAIPAWPLPAAPASVDPPAWSSAPCPPHPPDATGWWEAPPPAAVTEPPTTTTTTTTLAWVPYHPHFDTTPDYLGIGARAMGVGDKEGEPSDNFYLVIGDHGAADGVNGPHQRQVAELMHRYVVRRREHNVT